LISAFLGAEGSPSSGPSSGPGKGMWRMVSLEDQSLYKVSITTNLGLERTFGQFDSAIRSAHGIFFVYDVSSRKSFLAFEQWREVHQITAHPMQLD